MTRTSLRRVLMPALTALAILGLPAPGSASDAFVATRVSAAMGYQTCALDRTGAAYCWGYNGEGRLGDGTTSASEYDGPQEVIGGLRFRSIDAGSYHTCGITMRDEAYCWGYNPYGELGDGTTANSNQAGPQKVIGGLRFRSLSAGEYHTCGITMRDVAYCWGYNGSGELGDGTTVEYNEAGPQKVIGGLRFRSLSAGSYHTCGVTMRDEAYCWGYNGYGELGDGTTANSYQTGPQQVIGGLRFRSISAGYYFTCGLTLVGEAYCWGYNPYGEVGDGTTSNTYSGGPQKVIGGLRFRTIDTGWYLACGLTFEGDGYCWGYNGYGEFGDGTTDYSEQDGPQKVIGGLRFSTLEAGGYHACGMTMSGAVYCWGDNDYGQIGDGTVTDASSDGPQRVIAGES